MITYVSVALLAQVPVFLAAGPAEDVAPPPLASAAMSLFAPAPTDRVRDFRLSEAEAAAAAATAAAAAQEQYGEFQPQTFSASNSQEASADLPPPLDLATTSPRGPCHDTAEIEEPLFDPADESSRAPAGRCWICKGDHYARECHHSAQSGLLLPPPSAPPTVEVSAENVTCLCYVPAVNRLVAWITRP